MTASPFLSVLNGINLDMTEASQERPQGLTADWADHPRLSVGNDPAAYGYSKALGWGVVYAGAKGSRSTNTAVEVRSAELWVLSKRTGAWTLLQDSDATAVKGGLYDADFNNNASTTPTLKAMADGGVAVAMVGGKDFHFWADKTTMAINPNDVGGLLMSYKAKLVMKDPHGPDDRAKADYVGAAGADYWNGAMTANADAGIGRFKTITSSETTFTMSTLGAAQIAANPPTAYIGARIGAHVTHTAVAGQPYASYNTVRAANGTITQRIFLNGDGTSYKTATYAYGPGGTTVHNEGLKGLPYAAYDDHLGADGKLAKQVYFAANGAMTQTVTFAATATGSIRHVTDLKGLPYGRYDVALNAAGATTSAVYYKADGSVYQTTSVNKTAAGAVTHYGGLTDQPFSAYDTHTDNGGHVTRQVFYNSHGVIKDTGADYSAPVRRAEQTLLGTAGADLYAIANAFEPPYLVTDFHAEQNDKLALRAANFDMVPHATLVEGVNLLNGAAVQATRQAPTLLFDTSKHVLSFDPDGSGSRGATILANLGNQKALHAGNFTLV